MDRETRRTVWQRAGGRCEITGAALGDVDTGPWECHHRRNKGMGGTDRPDVDSPANLIALSPAAHRTVHGSRSWAQPRGYLIPKNLPAELDDPGMWPVHLLGRRWVLFTHSGEYAPVPTFS
jgi:5-methylcytosine-specific restriction enzyme A